MRLAAKLQKALAYLAASQIQDLHLIAAITLQSRQFSAMTQGG